MSDDLVERCEGFSELYAILKGDPAACDVSAILREAASTISRLQGELATANGMVQSLDALHDEAEAELTRLRAEVETVLAGGREDRETIDALEGRVGVLSEALGLALPILDAELCSYESDTPPARYDKRGFVCLDDLGHCAYDRWVECEATLTALAAIRTAIPASEWEANTYATTQAAVEHFASAALAETKPVEHAKALGVGE